MLYTIRARAIIINDNKILLVRHVDPKTNFEWWVTPGGGYEEKDKDMIQCVIRETWEETGYNISVKNMVYVREFYDQELNELKIEIFFKGSIVNGDLTIDNVFGRGKDEFFIKEAKWMNRDEIKELTVFPDILKTHEFWNNINNDFIYSKYLGKS